MNSWSRSNRKNSEQHWYKFQSQLINTSTLAKELDLVEVVFVFVVRM
jgi:hypothetical protein